MVSLDCVGPREVNGQTFHIVTMIDHHSRFLRTRVLLAPARPDAENIIAAFATAVVSSRTRLSRRTASIPSVPSGFTRARLLEHAVKTRASYEPAVPVVELVRDATLAYNSAPHRAHGESPFFAVTGQD
eukprot:Polyplicarium_translucidae@DN3352_c0_g2_i3.p4